MKKSLSTIVRLLGLGVVVSFGFAPFMVIAATLSLSPANVSVTHGQNFTVNVTLDPQGTANYTVRVELNYPVDLVEVQSFAFSSSWMPLTQPGYDSVDNANGVLVKTAGYPGGISLPVTFGTVSFRSKGAGSGSISITANSSVLDAGSRNVLSGVPTLASVTVNAPAPTPTPTPAPTTTQDPRAAIPPPTPLGTPEEEIEDEAIAEEGVAISEPQTFLAQVGSITTLGANKVIFGIVFAVAAFYAVYAGVKKVRRNGKGHKKGK